MNKMESTKLAKASPVTNVANLIPLNETENIIDYLRQSRKDNKHFLACKTFATAVLSPETKDSLLAMWLRQLKDNILFHKDNGDIANILLMHFDWVHKTPEVVTAYQDFVLNLISAQHCYYLQPALRMLLQVFKKGEDGTVFVTEKEKELFSRGHQLMKGIIALVPMSREILCGIVMKEYPYVKKDIHVHVCYVANVLEMCSYLPSHWSTLMQDLINHLLRLDVSCPRHQIEMDETGYSDVDEKTFPMDHDGTAIIDTDSMANPAANTLDVLMDYLIQYIRSVCFQEDGKQLKWEAAKKLFREMLTLFDKVILPIYGTTHVQFIMFYLCSLKPNLQEDYIDYLWKKVQDPNTPRTLRQAAMFYLGSFLARASFVTAHTVAVCLDLMCKWIHKYIDSQSYHNYVDISVHATFYAVCQTVFYIFAFRHRELTEMKNGLKVLQNLNFERIISCRLNPLKVCLPTIVQNFASISRSYQLAYCYTVIERNNRNLISSMVQSSNGTTECVKLSVLHTVFPFDPYLLKRSKKWIESNYRVYVAGDRESMDEQEDDFMLDEHSPSPKKSFTNYGSSLSARPLYSPSAR